MECFHSVFFAYQRKKCILESARSFAIGRHRDPSPSSILNVRIIVCSVYRFVSHYIITILPIIPMNNEKSHIFLLDMVDSMGMRTRKGRQQCLFGFVCLWTKRRHVNDSVLMQKSEREKPVKWRVYARHSSNVFGACACVCVRSLLSCVRLNLSDLVI